MFDQQLIQPAIDGKTKPPGSLGRVEQLAVQIAKIQQTLAPRAHTCKLTIFAADHGMALAGVSAYPQAVTRQMVLNFLAGGAASNVFAHALGIDFEVVDAGVVGDPIDDANLLDRRIAAGTANALEGPAMTTTHYDMAYAAGHALGSRSSHDGVCFGEMGIGNTAAASLVAAKILGLDVADLVGRGTGLDDAGVARKAALSAQAAARTPDQLEPAQALTEYGGFEMVMMTAAMIAAARAARIVMIDGFIASASALAASRLAPESTQNFIYAHRSAERGHQHVLDALKATPLLDLDMRLGEGTGALLAWPLVKAAAAMLREMASFDDAGVSGPA